MSKQRSIVLLGALLAAFYATAALAWSSLTYFDAGLSAGTFAVTNQSASRQWNKVWRPGGYQFGLAYTNLSWVYDTWSNPFVDNRTATSSKAWCLNNSGYYVSPVTCVTTVP